jgi:acyl carrier protein
VDPEVEQIIYEIVAEQFAEDPEAIDEDTRFVDDLGADSSAIVELQATIETRFGIDLTEEAAGATNVVTVGDLARLLDSTLEKLRYSSR